MLFFTMPRKIYGAFLFLSAPDNNYIRLPLTNVFTPERLLMDTLFEQRLNEIQLCLQNEDLNRAGQRLLDLTYDFKFDQPARDAALALRKAYNEGKQLGKAKNDNNGLQAAYQSLLTDISQQRPGAAAPPGKRKTIASINNISKHYHSVLHNFHFNPISMELTQGAIIGLVGENGNGKTTLLRMI